MNMVAARTLMAMLAVFASFAVVAADAPKSADTRIATEQKLQAAQQRLDAAAREVADLSMTLSDDVMPHGRAFSTATRQRAQLGIAIGTPGDSERREGVEILSVSPGGAAAAAGLQAGDVLTAINGKALQRQGDEAAREQLLSLMREVKPGEKVSVDYRRGDKKASVELTARAPADRMFTLPFPPDVMQGAMEGLPRMFFANSDGVFGTTELVSLTPKLGQYFGADKGLLVVRAPEDARLKIEEGDVIVDIDGRVPESAAHAARILGSYEEGETLHLNVLRMKKRMSLAVEIPTDAADRRKDRIFHRSLLVPRPGVPLPVEPPGPVTMAIRSRDDAV
jgi:S1-C subfamily serine protease